MRCPTCEQTIAANGGFCAGCGTGIVPATTSQPSIATPWHSTGQLTAAAPAMASPIPSPIQQVNVSVQAALVIVVADQAAGPGATIICLPFGLMMLNRLPQVVTLKSVTTQTNVTVKNGAMIVSQGAQPQQSFALRALYFALVGWWASLFWVEVAWLLSISVLGLPLAFWMFDRTPAITALAQR